VSGYTIYITPATFREIKTLPGNVKQRVSRVIQSLASNPRPSESRKLDTPEFTAELWRLRLDQWRIVYAITEDYKTVDILAVRKRPPYDYGDLETLLEELE
jgi:mRNA interferase RelE/StbE